MFCCSLVEGIDILHGYFTGTGASIALLLEARRIKVNKSWLVNTASFCYSVVHREKISTIHLLFIINEKSRIYQCSKFMPVHHSVTDSFEVVPGTFCWFFFKLMFMIWDSRHADLQLFLLSFRHWNIYHYFYSQKTPYILHFGWGDSFTNIFGKKYHFIIDHPVEPTHNEGKQNSEHILWLKFELTTGTGTLQECCVYY